MTWYSTEDIALQRGYYTHSTPYVMRLTIHQSTSTLAMTYSLRHSSTPSWPSRPSNLTPSVQQPQYFQTLPGNDARLVVSTPTGPRGFIKMFPKSFRAATAMHRKAVVCNGEIFSAVADSVILAISSDVASISKVSFNHFLMVLEMFPE